MKKPEKPGVSKKIVWSTTLFYALVAFEFFYMFSPFAVYMYSVYNPGLQVLSRSDFTTRLVSFFMPHIIRETSNFFITWHETFGWVFFLAGLGAFVIGAIQIYGSKLRRETTVKGGLYQKIRHPQYLALMIASFGMLQIWPRYLVLFAFVTNCFAYIWLARIEEGICRRSFPDYGEYEARTGMFLPPKIEALLPRLKLPQKTWKRRIIGGGFYVCALALCFLFANLIHGLSVASLYSYKLENSVYLSLGRLEPSEIKSIADITLADEQVGAFLELEKNPETRYLNYVMPRDLFVSEVPMYIPPGQTYDHVSPGSVDQQYYKVIFTKAGYGSRPVPQMNNIIRHAITIKPLVEVWVDRVNAQVISVLPPPENRIYGDVPVPIF
ncbi:MAG: hypothetical protein FWG99_12090 [Treponema sp.]|nr:hypothetical protein [Treponema sp.]